MMLGTFVKEAVEYCSKGDLTMPEKFNLLDLFNKLWEKKCDIYFSEEEYNGQLKTRSKNLKRVIFREKHDILNILCSPSEKKKGLGAINVSNLQQANRFLQSGRAEQFGIIREMTAGKLHFIYQCFADYFMAKCLLVIFQTVKNFISNNLFKST